MRKIAINVAITLLAATLTAWLLRVAFDSATPAGAGGVAASLTLVVAVAALIGIGVNLYLTNQTYRHIRNAHLNAAPQLTEVPVSRVPTVAPADVLSAAQGATRHRSPDIDAIRSALSEHGALMRTAVDDAIARHAEPDFGQDGILVPTLLKLLGEAVAADPDGVTLPVIFWGAGRTQDVAISRLKCSELLIARHEFVGGRIENAEITLRCGPGPIAFNGTTFTKVTLRAVDVATGALASGRLSFTACHADAQSTLNGLPIAALIKP